MNCRPREHDRRATRTPPLPAPVRRAVRGAVCPADAAAVLDAWALWCRLCDSACSWDVGELTCEDAAVLLAAFNRLARMGVTFCPAFTATMNGMARQLHGTAADSDADVDAAPEDTAPSIGRTYRPPACAGGVNPLDSTDGRRVDSVAMMLAGPFRRGAA